VAASPQPEFCGYKFRRQHPLACYVLDFYCPEAKLAIELDGGGHNYQLGQIRDQKRSNFLADHGVTVLRFWNHLVRYKLDSVLKAIWFALGERAFVATLTSILSLRKGEAGLVQWRPGKVSSRNRGASKDSCRNLPTAANLKSQNPNPTQRIKAQISNGK
jgi:very-short-patch-repair endonuclease